MAFGGDKVGKRLKKKEGRGKIKKERKIQVNLKESNKCQNKCKGASAAVHSKIISLPYWERGHIGDVIWGWI
jgi:hypothetical protein